MNVPLLVGVLGWFAVVVLVIALGVILVVLGGRYLAWFVRNVLWTHVWLRFPGPQQRFVDNWRASRQSDERRAHVAWEIIRAHPSLRRTHPILHSYVIEVLRESSQRRQELFRDVLGGSK